MNLLVTAAAVALVGVSGAVGAAKPKVIGTRGEVLSISADGGNVAIHAATKTARPCDSGSVWTPASGKVVRLVDENCSKNGADRHFMELTIAGSRAAWTDYDYGNHAYCIGPVTATLSAPRARDSGVCPDEPDNEDMYVEYRGDGSLLVGRSWLQCDSSCGPDYTGSYQDDVALYTISSRVKKLAGEKRNTDLLDVDAGRILLRVKKTLYVLDGSGKQRATFAVPGQGAAFMNGAGQVSVPSGAALLTYDASTGKVAETCTMKPGAKVWDVEDGLAVYSVGSELHLLTIANNRDRVVTTAKTLVGADLEPGGLFWAYNVPGRGTKPGRVSFLPASQLPR